MEQKSFVFKKKWYDEIKEVKSKTLQLEIFDTLFNYAFNGIEPSYDVSFISRSLWLRAKPNIDAGVNREDVLMISMQN